MFECLECLELGLGMLLWFGEYYFWYVEGYLDVLWSCKKESIIVCFFYLVGSGFVIRVGFGMMICEFLIFVRIGLEGVKKGFEWLV